MTDVKEVGIHALIRLPRRMLEADIGGPRLITVSRGLASVTKPPNAVGRTAAHLYLYLQNGSMGPEPWLIFVLNPLDTQAGNHVKADIEKYEEDEHLLKYMGEVPAGLLWSPSNKLSMVCLDMSQEFMDSSTLPHELLLPKRVPASLRLSEYWQLWVSL